jgi:hypothetical protein
METVTLNMPAGEGWTASFAQISPSSPLALLSLKQGNDSQWVRLDLDKRISIDPLTSDISPEFIRSVVERLSIDRVRLFRSVGRR